MSKYRVKTNLSLDYCQLVELIENYRVLLDDNTEVIYDAITGDICAFKYETVLRTDEGYYPKNCIDEKYVFDITMKAIY